MPSALVLVRNPVADDGRVLREAHVLQDLGFDVLVAGIVSREERGTELELDGVRVVRLLGPLESRETRAASPWRCRRRSAAGPAATRAAQRNRAASGCAGS